VSPDAADGARDDDPPCAPIAAAAALHAAGHAAEAGPPHDAPVWRRIGTVRDLLDRARTLCAAPPAEVSKAAEWLFDNEYQIRRAVRQVEADLPAAFWATLPRLAAPEHGRMPRVLFVGEGYLAACHVRPSADTAQAYIAAYQEHADLTLGELWAFPAMLRLLCVETVVRAFSGLVPGLEAPFPAARAGSHEGWHDETEAVSRAIVALAAISRIRWQDVVEQASRVEAILRTAPDGLHGAMEFETRDSYRNAVEDLAAGAGRPETAVAEAAVRRAAAHAGDPRRSHAGWWLVGGGRATLERALGYRPKREARLRRAVLARPGRAYAGALVGVGALALAPPLGLLWALGAGPSAWIALALLLVVPASIVAVTVTNWLVSRLVPPRVLPKMDFRKGVPEGHDAAVIMPVILRAAGEVAPLLSTLERHRLTNPDPRLRYVLLTDLADAGQERTDVDEGIERALARGIAALNARHPGASFALLHRQRRWAPAEDIWMGWERKRGKIEEFLEFVQSGDLAAFRVRAGEVESLRAIRYVVTLDADTFAPPGAILRLIGAMAHPLNRPEHDPDTGRVVEGHAVIQPRIEISPEAGGASRFARLYTGDTALDIYSRAVSDVYQDLFGEGIFTGKGGLDAAGFRACLAGRVPENALVSHDLFEGLHGRAALADDIVFYEGFPQRYADWARRQHRWIRGDWQLLPWLRPRVPGRGGQRLANPLTALDRWKIVDNLRRSLIAPSLVLLALVAWLLLPTAALVWTILVAAAPGSYIVTDAVSGLFRGKRRGAVVEWRRQALDHVGRWALAVAFMAHEAMLALDAIGRTLWRLTVSRRRLLEWTPAAEVAAAGEDTAAHAWRSLGGATVLAAGLGAALAALAPAALPGAAPLLVLWAASPEIARRIARPPAPPAETLDAADRAWLRRLARRTWLYFETFAGPEENWLAPDNWQAPPHAELARRTSPTNIGMQLLSTLTAHDLGHAGLPDAAARIANALDSLARLERHRGHVLNWIDTDTLEALEPRYVSTVDSGNLAMSLIALRQGCLEAADGPPLAPALWDGFADTIGLLHEAVAPLSGPAADRMRAALEAATAEARRLKDRPAEWARGVHALRHDPMRASAEALPALLDAAPEVDPHDLHLWLERSRHHLLRFERDLAAFCPWMALLDAPPPGAEPLAERLAATLAPDTPLARCDEAAEEARAMLASSDAPADWVAAVGRALDAGDEERRALRNRLGDAATRAGAEVDAMEFGFLYDAETRTFFIGYNLSADRIDEHRYDLLASEARLASYVAIAKGDVPAEHWVHLGRPLARSGGHLTALSWNGSMFEYLMPRLLIRSEAGELIGQSEAAAVEIQRRHGARLGAPWGVSEAAFAARDAAGRYQYRAFGVPGLGMRRGLGEAYVVAPYASALALAVRPRAAVRNLRRLAGMDMAGRYGLYDALDFTTAAEGAGPSPVRTFMAHHQGMLLAAIGNALTGDALVRRVGREPRVAAVDLLLHERMPWEYVPEKLPGIVETPRIEAPPAPPTLGAWPAPPGPQVHPVGNGRLSAWLREDGRSTLWWHGQALTGWSPDLAHGAAGGRITLRDAATGEAWDFSPDDGGEATFQAERATLHVRRAGLGATQEIAVSAADDVEIRRLTLVNDSAGEREIEVTFTAEIVLAPFAAHERHPAFSKLFVEAREEADGVLFSRRPRRPEDEPPVLLVTLSSGDPAVTLQGAETDRHAVLGRHGDPWRPAALVRALQGVTRFPLDPMVALRAQVRLRPGQRAELAVLCAAGGSRETVTEIAARHAGRPALDWAMEDAARTAALEAARSGLGQTEIEGAQALAARLLLPPAKPGGSTDGEQPGQPDLWGLGISGDLPVAVLRVDDPEHAPLLPIAVRAHRWWRRSGLATDLVVLRLSATGYEAPLEDRLRDALAASGMVEGLGGHGGIHLHGADRIATAQARALEAFARITLDGAADGLADAAPAGRPPLPLFAPGGPPPAPVAEVPRPEGLAFDNGIGGFTPEGDYAIHLADGSMTPAPWCNVLANPDFGTIVSEAGLGFTWSGNAGEHRLTPWSNDPVTDAQGEALYLRDEESAAIWTPTPLPAGDATACTVTHAPGRTEWRRASEGLEQGLAVVVPPEARVKLVRLRLHNPGRRARRLTATYVAEWVLGALPSAARPWVRCGWEVEDRALIARNGWGPDFAGRIAFLAASRPPHCLTCDRASFLGSGTPRAPEGLRRWALDGEIEAVRDACAAWQVHVDLAPGATEEVVFALGDAGDRADLAALAAQATPEGFAAAETANARAWERRLGAVQVATPDPALDLMVNRWLVTQATASRIFARAGFSQASGGIGFRDQLQDMMALVWSEPGRLRAHLLACAAHQFEEGDVLHWWHPPAGRGVRTRCSDDMLWLVHATHRYVTATGDAAVLDERVPFLSAPPLTETEEDRYAAFPAGEVADLFAHCRRAMERGATAGAHGLPLIGAGDWNDGMDRVGRAGRGESVWLAWFVADCARRFADLAELRGAADLAGHWRARAGAALAAAERAGWEGDRYLRAFDDSGVPWGSARNTECRIDSISQAWAALAGAPDRGRAETALATASAHLVDREQRLVKLLAPPFDRAPRDPGYIRAYPPGIRENGGQYTHAAAWLGLAFAALERGAEAHEIFDLIDPIRRTETKDGAARYRAEPYVVPGDVGGAPPFEGRAGWTWYTGAAAWTWRLAVEGLLGLELRQGRLRLRPALPPGWGSARATLRIATGTIEVTIEDPDGLGSGAVKITADGAPVAGDTVAFPGPGRTRHVHARLCGRSDGGPGPDG
jgi:cyclic beta-1,2-glucan synthetase